MISRNASESFLSKSISEWHGHPGLKHRRNWYASVKRMHAKDFFINGSLTLEYPKEAT
jgi:hypothetical protein